MSTTTKAPKPKASDFGLADPEFWDWFKRLTMNVEEERWLDATADLYHSKRVEFYEAAYAKVVAKVKKPNIGHREIAKNVAMGTFAEWKFRFEAATEVFEGTPNPRFGIEDDVWGAPPAPAEDLTDLAEWLAKQTWSNFAVSLAEQFARKGELSEKQVASAKKMRTKVEANAAKRETEKKTEAKEAVATPVDLTDLPSGMYAVPGGDTRLKLRVSRSKRDSANGRWKAGTIWVNDDAAYGERTLYGFQAPGEAEYKGKVREALQEVMKDPFEASVAYGRLVGRCGVCGARLEDETSVANGIGPICASKF